MMYRAQAESGEGTVRSASYEGGAEDLARLEVGGEALPLELTMHVLSFLEARDRLSLRLVSRPFRALADDDLYFYLPLPFD